MNDPANQGTGGPPPVSLEHPPTEADIAARQQLIGARIARQVDLLGYILVLIGLVGAVAALQALASGIKIDEAFAAALLPVGAGLIARSRVAANLTFFAMCGAIAYTALLVWHGPRVDAMFGGGGQLELHVRLLFGALLLILPAWGLRTLVRGMRLQLFDANPLRMPGVRGADTKDDRP